MAVLAIQEVEDEFTMLLAASDGWRSALRGFIVDLSSMCIALRLGGCNQL